MKQETISNILVTMALVSLGLNLFVFAAFIGIDGYVLRTTRGISMCPDAGKLSLVIHKLVESPEDLIIGEAYSYTTFHNEERITIHHRYTDRIDNEWLLFKGDNNKFSEAVQVDSVKSKLIYRLVVIPCKPEDINVH